MLQAGIASRRIALVVGALVVAAAAITTPAFAGSRAGKEGDDRVSQSDAEVFMTVGASQKSINAVRVALLDSPLVKSFRFLDKDAALKEFRRIFASDPDLVHNVDRASLPVSFRVRLNTHTDVDRFTRTFERMTQVDSVESPSSTDPAHGLASLCEQRRDPAITEIFMNVTASMNAIDAIRVALDSSEMVAQYTFLDKSAAYEEFKRIFRNDPDLVKNVKPAALPVSFRVRLVAGADLKQFEHTFEAMAEVDSVETPINDPLTQALDQFCQSIGATPTTTSPPPSV